ncbi:MAG TPA: type II toxin-antitoxin system prevent-host-death family antitoxin [Candidatus Saccharimonadales bacterium]|nr:type II toxin-antitoxin system prevent-host-death family antitoxin [Candidatus Saccharimonadales bacterium]
MSIQTTSMSKARAHFAEALESATNGGVVLVQRRGKPDAAIVDADLLEDFLASTNPRIIKKIQKARKENEDISFDEAFAGIL